MAEADKLNIDSIIQRLLEVKGSRPGKNVQLTENEIRGLCLKSREIFLSQPILLELEAPLKICGLSPDLQSMEQVRRVMRPTDVPDQGLLCDLLWADPDKDVLGWGENDRGVSFTFGADVVTKFLHKHDMDLICRAHQVVEDGYEFFAKRQLVTLFSAPNYCGEFDNAGAMMSVDETLMCSFQILKPADKKLFYGAGGSLGSGRPVTPPRKAKK
ncbi:hypothetical protein PFLUV_G00243760 [Perca fluviatilis]|uniref:protein-serine/threonine phosphatase n=1 Tax=Perca fluviatilis TaxID=8168 RepID=A0A6A5ECU7_PERFL|nr:hypothetical protein PFLUV_G00243760 [Perca fluviatilis]